MNADEIVKALRTLRCADPCNCLSCPCEQFRSYVTNESCDDGTRLAAADLIESLQADLRHEEKVSHGQMEQNKRLRKMMDKLQANLAESQRRERTAVEDIEKMMRICEKGSCHFCADGDCTNSPMCTPKWRGPREDGKGEAK